LLTVQFTEYRMADKVSHDLTDVELVTILTDSGAEVVEQIRLAVLEGAEGKAQLGRNTAVNVGTSSNAAGQVRAFNDRAVGTTVNVLPRFEDGLLLLSFVYETSRLDGSGADDRPPDIVTYQISSELLVELNRPTLVASTSVAPSSYLVVQVSR
jgi:type II secretory pathway component GspD/PulD (secretin)